MRRFIAGAVCPQCGEIDRLVMDAASDRRVRECVHCGYRDELPGVPEAPEEPATRLRRPESAESDDEAVQILRLDDGVTRRR